MMASIGMRQSAQPLRGPGDDSPVTVQAGKLNMRVFIDPVKVGTALRVDERLG